MSESEEDSKPENPQNDVKFLVFKEQMDKLLKRCPELCRREKGIICDQGWMP